MRNVKEKKERALGTKLFLKADRCNSPKCAMIRRPHAPGVHGAKRKKQLSEFGRQFQEKQKLQITYGLTNRQMTNIFKSNEREEIMEALEKRLDRVVFLFGFAKSTRVARQLVSHGHITVNKKKVTVSSYITSIGNKVGIREESRKLKMFEDIETYLKQYTEPKWLRRTSNHEGEIVAKPEIDKASSPFDVSLVGEFYARR
ncbi:hypothetical protein A3A21_01595 [Candidatus Jorgensenbacteria bacterium RIFCSPLOWO2_01_FULL_45_25b]|uniref:Small ribosomal subunit protein uS4 n=1 Tax=Candidatus Jorgensenbacteria bacterium RIFCSPLOWO2_01_FULL_45_25b TaxID=1798471 RepID=A0A1F6BU66_9BACT|nr:MAG: hypothetical protein A3A21_01595 [Candidatus Jorgensenbacteria bacterium RIFCSPLOWO2_01_FULL_45_25b]